MPKISDEHRELRRRQILEAAWRCFQREGVQGTRIEQILAESGLAASALYRYFKNKDDIILAAIENSMQGLSLLLEPLVEEGDEIGPAAFVGYVAHKVRQFSERSGYNLMSIAVHGWSEAQRNDEVRVLLARFYLAFRDRLTMKARRWQAGGLVQADADPKDVAQAVLSTVLGDVVQTAIVGPTEVEATSRGISALRGECDDAAPQAGRLGRSIK